MERGSGVVGWRGKAGLAGLMIRRIDIIEIVLELDCDFARYYFSFSCNIIVYNLYNFRMSAYNRAIFK